MNRESVSSPSRLVWTVHHDVPNFIFFKIKYKYQYIHVFLVICKADTEGVTSVCLELLQLLKLLYEGVVNSEAVVVNYEAVEAVVYECGQ